jgi:hypothetical protein
MDKLTDAQKQLAAESRKLLEHNFDTIWCWLGGPELESEFKFHPDRNWRFDRAFPALMIAIEIEGGTWSGGRHSREPGYSNDCEKYNAASLLGWRIFRFTGPMLDNPDKYIKPVADFLSEWAGGRQEND